MSHSKGKNVFFLGLTSFFADVSSEMVFSILPLFMAGLGLSKTTIGVIEGIAQAVSSILKTVSGWVSDRVHFRKPFLVIGYTVSAILRPFMALANFWYQIFAVRFVDRIGKGIRNAPRDALIADSTDPEKCSQAFGLTRAMDTAGAVVGTALASILLLVLSKYFNLDALSQYRTIFWLSAIPAGLSVLVVSVYIKDIRHKIEIEEKTNLELTGIKSQYKVFLFVSGLFELSKFSYVLFMLRAYNLGTPAYLIPAAYLIYNIAYAASAQPVGQFADHSGVKKVLAVGYLMFCFTHLGFAFSTTAVQAWMFLVLYGISMAFMEVVPPSMVMHCSTHENRGAAYGYYHTTIGIMAIPATVFAGALWDLIDPTVAFSYGALIALISTLILKFGIKEVKKHGH